LFQYVFFEKTEDAISPEDTELAEFESAVATVKGGLPVVRALSLHLEEGTGDAGGAGGVVAGAGAVSVAPPVPAEEDGLGPVRPVPDGVVRVIIRAGGVCLGQ